MKVKLSALLSFTFLFSLILGFGPGMPVSMASNTNNPTFLNGSWQQDEKGWRFAQNYGNVIYPENQWGKFQNQRYFFDSEGYIVTGWLTVDGSWYYFRPEDGKGQGAMLTGWLYDHNYNGWFYFNHLGIMVTGWHKIDGHWYYFNQESDGYQGIMAVNQIIDDHYVDHDGRMNEIG